MKRIAAIAAPTLLLALTACGGSSSSSPKTVTVSATPDSTSSSTSSESSSADYPTPPESASATEPTGLSADLTADQRDKFQSFRLTMNSVVPKSYGLSDSQMVGLAAYVCSQAEMNQPRSMIELAIPGVIQRTAPGQPTWDQHDAEMTVDKAEVIYCNEKWSAN